MAASLPTVALGSTGLTVSKIGFGCMGITAFYGPPMDDDAAVELLKSAYAHGYTHFDTAELYRSGNPFEPPTPETKFNEVQIGKFLQTLPRDSFTVATKFMPRFHGGKVDLATVTASVDESLQRLGLSYVDLYYSHRMPDTLEGLEEWMRSAKALVEAGKIKHVGLSEVCPEWLRKAHAIHPVACIQQEWSVMTRNLEDTLVPVCKELNIGIVAYSPLSRNLLCNPVVFDGDWRKSLPRYEGENYEKNLELFRKITALAERKGKTAAQLSLAWLYHQAKALGVSMIPIPGTTKAANAADNAAACGVELTEEEVRQIGELGAVVAGQRYSEQHMSMTFEAQLGA